MSEAELFFPAYYYGVESEIFKWHRHWLSYIWGALARHDFKCHSICRTLGPSKLNCVMLSWCSCDLVLSY